MFSFERSSSKEYGGESKKDTPVPMPNTEVKLLNAESSWWATACEDRKLPSFLIFRLSSVVERLTVNQDVVSSSLTAGVKQRRRQCPSPFFG